MKTIVVRLPEALATEIERESRKRRVSKSDIVRERLQNPDKDSRPSPTYEAISDLIGSVEELPGDLSSRTDHYLRATGYGRSRSR